MYIPAPFRVDDSQTTAAFMRQFDFADVTIVGHLARANEHWKLMDGRSESMAIFAGPHGYISPSWYASAGPAVPTWNYAVVHAYGRPVAREESHRQEPWTTDRLPAEAYDKMLNAIVGFEMRVERCDAKSKLGQNRPAVDRASAAAGLDGEQSSASAALADFMRRYGGAGK